MADSLHGLSLDDPATFKLMNPKRAGSMSHYWCQKYKTALTVKEALELGAATGDIKNDHSKGFLFMCSCPCSKCRPALAAVAGAAPPRRQKQRQRCCHLETRHRCWLIDRFPRLLVLG